MPTHIVRIVVQLLLAGPVLLLLPMALVVSGAALFSFAGGDSSGVVMALMVFPATLAFAALLASILMPVAAICQRRWLLWSVRIFLCLGMLMASVLLFSNPWSGLETSDALTYAWTGLGALFVAAWNLYRMQVHVSAIIGDRPRLFATLRAPETAERRIPRTACLGYDANIRLQA